MLLNFLHVKQSSFSAPPVGRVAGDIYPTELHVGTGNAGLKARPYFTWASGYMDFCSVGSLSQP